VARAVPVREGDAVSLSWSAGDARWFGVDGEAIGPAQSRAAHAVTASSDG
jgi:hypothetical protein